MALTVTPAELTATALTLTTAAQPNITSVGTLSALTVSGNLNATLTTAAQPNITSVGTLSSLKTSGNVSIGNSSPVTWHSGWEALQIGERAVFFSQASTTAGIGENVYYDSGSNWKAIATAPGSLYQLDSGNHHFYTQASVSAGAAASPSEKFTILNNGNVGIGDSTPQALLDVGGGYGSNTTVATFAHATDAYVEIENITTQNGAGIILTNAGTKKWTIQKDTSAHHLTIQDANSDNIMTFLQGGNVGMNELTPTSYYSKTFQINGSGNTSAIKMTNTSTGNENGRGHDIASDAADLRLVNREVGHVQTYTTASIGSPLLAVDVDEYGRVRLPRQAFFQANGSGGSWTTIANEASWNYGIHNSTQPTTFWSEGTDRGLGHFNPSNGRFTAPVTGWYIFCCSLYVRNTNGVEGTYIHPQFFKNDSLSYQNGKSPYRIIATKTTTNPEYMNIAWTENIYMTATQYLNVAIYFRSQGAWEHYPDYAIWTGGLIG